MKMGLKFAIYYNDDAYTTAKKIMGRQSAGQSLLSAVAHTWPQSDLSIVGSGISPSKLLIENLKTYGYKASVRWASAVSMATACEKGALYYPAPPVERIAAMRNVISSTTFSIFGVTHTLASHGAIEQISKLIFEPFKKWDALICTSSSAHRMVSNLLEEMKQYWRITSAATRFNDISLPVIPLGVDSSAFIKKEGEEIQCREMLNLKPEDKVILFAGRLSFHAKSNPAPMYQAMEKLANVHNIVCIEAGIHANEHIKKAYISAQSKLAPSVRFIHIDGSDTDKYKNAWNAADLFVSLSDNVQETFGITPVEAMAAGLPVIVADWDGYKDTVRDGIDGFRIQTITPPSGIGSDISLRYMCETDSYDRYIGNVSLGTVVNPDLLHERLKQILKDDDLRKEMGRNAQQRVRENYDWKVILRQYNELSDSLAEIRKSNETAQKNKESISPIHADPYHRFASFPSTQLQGHWKVVAHKDIEKLIRELTALAVCNYGIGGDLIGEEAIWRISTVLTKQGQITVNELLYLAGMRTNQGVRALMWMWKFDLVKLGN
jgi:starch synthase